MDLEIIAELAQGYEGNASIAKLLVKSAALAGADSAKFQLVIAEELATISSAFFSPTRAFHSLRNDLSWVLDSIVTKENIERKIKFGRKVIGKKLFCRIY